MECVSTMGTSLEENEEMHKRLNLASHLLWTGKLEEAKTLLLKYMKKEESLYYNLYYAMIFFVEAVITEKSVHVKEAYRHLDALGKRAMTVEENNKGESVHDGTSGFWGGWMGKKERRRVQDMQKTGAAMISAYAVVLRSLLQLKTGVYVKGVYNVRKGWKMLAECYTPYSKFFDHAHGPLDPFYITHMEFGVAMFNFVVSLCPPSLLWMIEAIGFEANRKKAIELLYTLKDSPYPIALCSNWFLIWIKVFFFERFEEAEPLMNHTLKAMPDAIMFLYLGGQLKQRQGQTKEAIEMYQKALTLSKQIRQMQLIFHFELGECHIILEDWETALKHLTIFLEENESTAYRCWAAYRAGIASCFLGNNKDATLWFKKTITYARKHFSFDYHAKRKARQYLKEGSNNNNNNNNSNNGDSRNNGIQCIISEPEKILLVTELRRKARTYELCLEILEDIVPFINHSTEIKGSYYYLKGRANSLLDNKEDALKCFMFVVELKSEIYEERYIVPHSMNEIGEIYLAQESKGEAVKWFKKAKQQSSGYDFDKVLSRRIKRNLDRVNGKEL